MHPSVPETLFWMSREFLRLFSGVTCCLGAQPIDLQSSWAAPPAPGAPERGARVGAGAGRGALGTGSKVGCLSLAHRSALTKLTMDQPRTGRAEHPDLHQVPLRDVSVHGGRGSKCWDSHGEGL